MINSAYTIDSDECNSVQSFIFYYKSAIANKLVISNPIITGTKFFLASSAGDTLQIAATGMTAHGIIVPPPIQMVVI